MALEYRIVEQNRDVKIVKRDVLWQHETRKPGAPDFDPARTIEVYGTDESVDRHNTKLRVDGWDFKDYRNNPTLLWLHNMDDAAPKMPLGSVIAIEREEYARADAPEGAPTQKRLLFRAEFPVRGTYGFADLAHDMWKQGHLRAASVGFRNLKMRQLNLKDDKEEMEKEGYDLKAGWAADLTHNSLMELSLVPVGSNPNALKKALREAAPAEFRAFFDHPNMKDEEIDEQWISVRLEALRVALTPVEEKDEEATIPVVENPNPESNETEQPEPTDEVDTMSDELDRALAQEVLAIVPDPMLKAIEDSNTAIRAQLVQVLSEMQTLRDEMKAMRDGAVPAVGNTPASAEPEPSHLDILLDENVEHLERIASIMGARK